MVCDSARCIDPENFIKDFLIYVIYLFIYLFIFSVFDLVSENPKIKIN